MHILVDKLLSLQFTCVDIDDLAKAAHEHMSISSLESRMDRNKFISFRTKTAMDAVKKENTVMNHHLAIHNIIKDRFICDILKIDKLQGKDRFALIDDIFGCSQDKELIKDLKEFYAN